MQRCGAFPILPALQPSHVLPCFKRAPLRHHAVSSVVCCTEMLHAWGAMLAPGSGLVIYPLILDNILLEVMNRPTLHGCSHVSTRRKDALPPWL